MLPLCELWSGSTRFNEIQRGVPGMSPGLLSKRLKELEANGLVRKKTGGTGAHTEYVTTAVADELEPLIRGLGEWAHRNIDSTVSLQDLDAQLLMWNIRRSINQLELPRRKCFIQFVLNEPPDDPVNYWLLSRPGEETDLCFTDPKHEVDLFVITRVRVLGPIWIGKRALAPALEREELRLHGRVDLARSIDRWLMLSVLAG